MNFMPHQLRMMSFASTKSLVTLAKNRQLRDNLNVETFHQSNYENLLPTSNVLYINNENGCRPALQLRINSQIKEIILNNATTLSEVKSWVLREFQSLASIQRVSFFSADGTELSLGSRF